MQSAAHRLSPERVAAVLPSRSIPRVVAPAVWVEIGYYAITLYPIFGVAWGIAVPMAGAALMALLAGLCFLSLGRSTGPVLRALLAPLLCASTFLFIQIMFHGDSVVGELPRAFYTWVFSMVVAQTLVLRQGFLHRFAVFAFVVLLILLPYVRWVPSVNGAYQAALDRRISIANSNDFAAWAGFCCLYFVILGLETKYLALRAVSWVGAAGCILVVGLTLSRGTLLAVAIGGIVALRRILKRGFLPVLSLFVGLWMLYAVGFLDSMLEGYAARGTVETGRLLVWPLVLERFLDAPFIGYGASNSGTWVAQQGMALTPHNSILFFAVSAGIVPTFFYLLTWWRAARISLAVRAELLATDQPFRLPLLAYCFLVTIAADTAFMSAWAIVTLAFIMLPMPNPTLRSAARVGRVASRAVQYRPRRTAVRQR